MIPLRDVIPSRTVPFVTVTLILLNAAAWVLELSMSQRGAESVIRSVRRGAGGIHGPVTLCSRRCSCTAAGSHVIGNMWWLWIFGDNVEDEFGHGRFLVFYLLCGLTAALGQIVMDPTSHAADNRRQRRHRGRDGRVLRALPSIARAHARFRIFLFNVIEVPAIFLLGFWFLMQLVNAGAVASTANAGRAASRLPRTSPGFVVGILGVFVFRRRQRFRAWDG